MIKGIVDRVRNAPGYAGMAVYYNGTCVYVDLIDERLADGIYHLFSESPGKRVTAIMRGYTIMAFGVGGSNVVARLEGRYAAPPDISPEEDDIALAEPAPCEPAPCEPAPCLTREEARREAQELLKSFNLINRD